MAKIMLSFKKSFLKKEGLNKEGMEKCLAILSKEFRKAFAPGTIRVWKGKKYIKGADKKWRPYHQKAENKLAVKEKEKKPELDAIEIDKIPENFKTMKVKELHSGKILTFTPEEGRKGRVEGWEEGVSYSIISMDLDNLKESSLYKILSVDIGNGEKAVFKKYKELEYEVTQKEIDRYRIETSFTLNHDFKFIKQELEKKGVVYNPVKKFKKIPSEEEIINNLANFDGTGGSCASLAFCYAAQKWGYDVIDFRGGGSQEVFSHAAKNILMEMGNKVEKAEGDEAGAELLSRVFKGEAGKQYLLSAGHHCAVVRKNYDGKLQYLELQAEGKAGGWQNFDEYGKKGGKDITTNYGFSQAVLNGLEKRFDIKNDSDSIFNIFDVRQTAKLFDIDAGIKEEKMNDFLNAMGYINTKGDKQKVKTLSEWIHDGMKLL